MKIKILSYNIHKGFDWKNRNYFLREIKEFISQTDADVVCLQEVVGKNTKFQNIGLIDSQFEFLADSIWSHYSYGKNAVYDHGHHGNLILSKFPIESFENIDLSTNHFEKRGLLICKISIPDLNHNNNSFNVACSHLNLLHSGRTKQYHKIKSYLANNGNDNLPLVIAGDFNDWNHKSDIVFENELNMKEVHKFKYGTFAKTFPSIYPMLCLDRIYVRNLIIHNVQIVQPNPEQKVIRHFSDHLALICEVEFYES